MIETVVSGKQCRRPLYSCNAQLNEGEYEARWIPFPCRLFWAYAVSLCVFPFQTSTLAWFAPCPESTQPNERRSATGLESTPPPHPIELKIRLRAEVVSRLDLSRQGVAFDALDVVEVATEGLEPPFLFGVGVARALELHPARAAIFCHGDLYRRTLMPCWLPAMLVREKAPSVKPISTARPFFIDSSR